MKNQILHRITGEVILEYEGVLRDRDLTRVNLSEANLSGANLIVANLTGADLSGANLTRADLAGADLIGVNLFGGNLIGANLNGANLAGANLSGANLTVADLTGANLTGADLTGADLSGVNLTRVNLSEASGAYKIWDYPVLDKCQEHKKKSKWIKWEGGDCPVPDDTQVKVKFGNIREHKAHAGYYEWRWNRAISQIIAYKVIEEKK